MARGKGRKNESKGKPTDKGTGKAKTRAEGERTSKMEKARATEPLENAPTPRGAPHMQRKGKQQR